MKISVYTSCALNYLPKARVLAESLAAAEPEATLSLCLNDVPPPWLDLGAEPFRRVWLPEDLGYDRGWIFQHNVMELSTAVKGRALLRLIEEDAPDLAIYLDPDVLVLNPLRPIGDYLGDASVGLVPHILAPEETEIGVELTEISVASHGVYNLGHLVVRPDARGMAFARWWTARLDRHCFDDRARGLFTDQRWVDLAPAILEGVKILKAPNLDVASWNLSHRRLAQTRRGDPAAFTVDGQPLITYHFSGTGPSGTHRRIREIFAPGCPAAAELERLYEAAIRRQGQALLAGRPPAYDSFDDGTPVSAEARRLYRRHADLQRAFPDPYACPVDRPSYRDWLRRHRPGVIDGLTVPAHRLEAAYAELFDAGYYLATYPDAAEAVAAGAFRDALDHYERLGARLLYDPNELFVSSWYLDRAMGNDSWPLSACESSREGTLLWHYLTTGLPSGIEPVEFFDSRWYLARNADVEAAFRQGRIGSPLGHFLRHGSREGRDPGPLFQGAAYFEANPRARRLAEAGDVPGAFGAFVRLGGVAGRIAV
jgi:hypothetical protein